MAKAPLRQILVSFVAATVPDSRGIRIRTLEPWGLYVALKDMEAGKFFFPKLLSTMIEKRNILSRKRGEAIIVETDFDWEAILASGKGEVIVRIMDILETAEMVRESTYESTRTSGYAPPILMEMADPDGLEFYLVHDEDDVDDWLQEAVTKDFEEGRNRPPAALLKVH